MTKLPLTFKMKQDKLKVKLIDAIIVDCDKSDGRKLYWAEKFVNKLLPQEANVSGKDGEPISIIIKKYAGD